MVKQAALEAQALGNLTKSQQQKSDVASSPAYKIEYQKVLNSMSRRGDPDEKIFFIVKSGILGCFGSAVFLLLVLMLGAITFWEAIYLAPLTFLIPFVVGRYFEKEIDAAALRVTKRLNKRRSIKRLIVKYM